VYGLASISVLLPCPASPSCAIDMGPDYLTMIGVSLRKAAIVAASRFR
jgi:hypothetical protein